MTTSRRAIRCLPFARVKEEGGSGQRPIDRRDLGERALQLLALEGDDASQPGPSRQLCVYLSIRLSEFPHWRVPSRALPAPLTTSQLPRRGREYLHEQLQKVPPSIYPLQ